MCQKASKYGIFNKKIRKIFWGPFRPFPQWGGGIPSPHSHPSRRLRRLNPSHSKILGTPLSKCWTVGTVGTVEFLVGMLNFRMYSCILGVRTVLHIYSASYGRHALRSFKRFGLVFYGNYVTVTSARKARALYRND